MPKYYFRTTMCTTFTLECGKDTLFSDIKLLFGKEFNINSNFISIKFMNPNSEELSNNAKIGSCKPIERSFFILSFAHNFPFPKKTKNERIKILDSRKHEKNSEVSFEYDKNAEALVDYCSNEYTIFSDKYQTHSEKPKFDENFDPFHENTSQFQMTSLQQNNLPSSDFIINLLEIYKQNKIEDFKKLLQSLDESIDNEIKEYPFPSNNLGNISKQERELCINDFKKRLKENPQIFVEILNLIKDTSPESAEILTNQGNDIFNEYQINLPTV